MPEEPSAPARRPGTTRGRADGRVPFAPMYKRLPRGPHRLAPEEVAFNQRARIHGAMIEAVSRGGYQRASVRQVIALAGVSRRAFYELFANREDCFLATFDLLARRELRAAREAYLAAGGGRASRLSAALASCTRTVREDRAAALLLLVEAPRAGSAGAMRLLRGSRACERMLGECLAASRGGAPQPAAVLTGIAGGLRGALVAALHDDATRDGGELAEKMLGWTLSIAPAVGWDAAARLSGRPGEHRRGVRALGPPPGGARTPAEDERGALLLSALRLAARPERDTPSAAEIADGAGVSIDAFFARFESRDDCLQAALSAGAERLLGAAERPTRVAGDWPQATRGAIGALLGHLAANPLDASALVGDDHSGEAGARSRSVALQSGLDAVLTSSIPADCSRFARAALVPALWHTVRCEVIAGRTDTLAALADEVSYVALAPVIGAGEAIELLREPLDSSRACESADRGCT